MDELHQVIFRKIEGFPNYRIGDNGTVWSKATNSKHAVVIDGWHEIKGGLDKDGYRKLILCHNGVRRHARVNILVLESFVGRRPDEMVCAHKDGNRVNNRLDNLRWATQK